jgi:membrane-associated phospholipid phosphatase
MLGYLVRTRAFIIPFLILLGGSGLLLLIQGKLEVELWVNAHHSVVFDTFFRYATLMGDGIFALILALIIGLVNLRRGFIIFMGYAVSGILIQLIKNLVFPGMDRPLAILGDTYTLHLVEGVKVWTHQSFPSGHAGTAFSVFFCLAAWSGSKSMQFLFFLLASAIAYSRIYLLQHFLPDVMAGALIGTFCSLLVIVWISKQDSMKFLDKQIIKSIGKHVQ